VLNYTYLHAFTRLYTKFLAVTLRAETRAKSLLRRRAKRSLEPIWGWGETTGTQWHRAKTSGRAQTRREKFGTEWNPSLPRVGRVRNYAGKNYGFFGFPSPPRDGRPNGVVRRRETWSQKCAKVRIVSRKFTKVRTDQGRGYAMLRIVTGGTNFLIRKPGNEEIRNQAGLGTSMSSGRRSVGVLEARGEGGDNESNRANGTDDTRVGSDNPS